MRSISHFSACLVFSICSVLGVHLQAASAGRIQQDSQRDSLRSRSSPAYTPGRDRVFKFLPRYNPKRDPAGFKFIPKNYGEPQGYIAPDINPSDFVPYQQPPKIQTRVKPKYPDAALRDRLEGSVFVKILVSRKGKAEQVSVLKSDARVFDGPAIEAAKHFVFTPAYINHKPVAAWMTYEFRFRLPKKK